MLFIVCTSSVGRQELNQSISRYFLWDDHQSVGKMCFNFCSSLGVSKETSQIMKGLFCQACAPPPLWVGSRLITAHTSPPVSVGGKCVFNGAPQTTLPSATLSFHQWLRRQQPHCSPDQRKRANKQTNKRSDEGGWESEFHAVIICFDVIV